jgi:hypothetical protein
MPVVINEFEVVAEPPPTERRSGGEAAAGPHPPAPIAPPQLAAALHSLKVQALRIWAH